MGLLNGPTHGSQPLDILCGLFGFVIKSAQYPFKGPGLTQSLSRLVVNSHTCSYVWQLIAFFFFLVTKMFFLFINPLRIFD